MAKYFTLAERKQELLGREFPTNRSGNCIVVDYRGFDEVVVKFYEPEFYVTCSLGHLRNGQVTNPLFPSMYGVGCIGVGKYSSKDKRLFSLWSNMLQRSSYKTYHKSNPTYKDATLCDEWLNFQNFAEWCDTQKTQSVIDNTVELYELDKDILVRGNKLYSPDTCCFVPKEINSLLVKRNKMRGECLIGVSYHKKGKKFQAKVNRFGITEYLGLYSSEYEAFLVYKEAKESHIKNIAETWKDCIDYKVYQALLNYEVLVTD